MQTEQLSIDGLSGQYGHQAAQGPVGLTPLNIPDDSLFSRANSWVEPPS